MTQNLYYSVYIWGQSLVFLLLVTPKISIPVGFVFSQPAPQLSVW